MPCSRLLPLACLVLLAGCAHRVAPPVAAPASLHYERFGARAADARTLIVVLHDDSPDSPDSAYRAAEAFARDVPGSITAVVLRPGFTDLKDHRSQGAPESGGGDGYTTERLREIAATIRTIQRASPQVRTLLVGQGGGAAIAADLAGTQARIADAMLLLGCPCMLDEWREDRAAAPGGSAFATPVSSLDPLKTVGGVSPSLQVTLLVGANDEQTKPRYSRGYAEALALRGVATDFRILTDKGHDLLEDPETRAAVQRLAAVGGRVP
jgi:pimeloyl-ACP methyl ester carboxylesterase